MIYERKNSIFSSATHFRDPEPSMLCCLWGIKKPFHDIEDYFPSLNRILKEIKSRYTFSYKNGVGHVEIVSAMIYIHQSCRGGVWIILALKRLWHIHLSCYYWSQGQKGFVICFFSIIISGSGTGSRQGQCKASCHPWRRDLYDHPRPLIHRGPEETSQCITSLKTPCDRLGPSFHRTKFLVCDSLSI